MPGNLWRVRDGSSPLAGGYERGKKKKRGRREDDWIGPLFFSYFFVMLYEYFVGAFTVLSN